MMLLKMFCVGFDTFYQLSVENVIKKAFLLDDIEFCILGQYFRRCISGDLDNRFHFTEELVLTDFCN